MNQPLQLVLNAGVAGKALVTAGHEENIEESKNKIWYHTSNFLSECVPSSVRPAKPCKKGIIWIFQLQLELRVLKMSKIQRVRRVNFWFFDMEFLQNNFSTWLSTSLQMPERDWKLILSKLKNWYQINFLTATPHDWFLWLSHGYVFSFYGTNRGGSADPRPD